MAPVRFVLLVILILLSHAAGSVIRTTEDDSVLHLDGRLEINLTPEETTVKSYPTETSYNTRVDQIVEGVTTRAIDWIDETTSQFRPEGGTNILSRLDLLSLLTGFVLGAVAMVVLWAVWKWCARNNTSKKEPGGDEETTNPFILIPK